MDETLRMALDVHSGDLSEGLPPRWVPIEGLVATLPVVVDESFWEREFTIELRARIVNIGAEYGWMFVDLAPLAAKVVPSP